MSFCEMSRRLTAGYLTGSSTNITSAAKSNSRPLQHRGNHVASLLACRQPETLAEQLLAQQEHNNELQEQLKHALTDARHKEVELRRCRQALVAAEGLLQARQRPCVTILQPTEDQDGNDSAAASSSSSPRTYRVRRLSPRRAAAAALSCTQQACLVGALKDQNAALKSTISQLEQQCTVLSQPGGVAVQVGSLQQQLAVVLGQLQQQQQLVHQLACRAEDAQQTAQATAAHVELARKALQEVQAAAAAAVQGNTSGKQLGQDLLDLLAAFVGPTAAGQDASSPCPSRALAAAQDAHRMLLQQALLLRGRLPTAPGFAGVAAAAHGRPRSASRCSSPSRPDRPDAAAELLMFLRSHVARLQATLDSLPGACAASTQQAVQASGEDAGSWHAGAGPAAVGVMGRGQTAEQHGYDSNSSPSRQRVRPCSAQAGQSTGGVLPAAGLLARPASAAPASRSRRMQRAQQPQQQRQLSDFSPYLNYPGRRVASGGSREVAALQRTVQQLQALLQEQQQLMQAQAEEAMQLQQCAQSVHQQLEAAQQQLADSQQAATAEQQQLQQAVEQLQQHNAQLEQQLAAKQQEVTQMSAATAGEQQLLHTALQQLQQHSAQVQQQLAVSQAAAAAEQHKLQAEMQRLQQHHVGLQQQLAAAKQEREDAQQASQAGDQHLQPLLEQVQQLHLQVHRRYVAEQQVQQQLEQLEQALLRCERQVQGQQAAQPIAAAGSAAVDAAWLAHSVAAYAAVLSHMPAMEALNSGCLQELSAAVAKLLAAMRQVLGMSASAEGSMSVCTGQLEEQLVENTEAVEECMAALQEVCAASRKASAAGSALLVNFSPYATGRTSTVTSVRSAAPVADDEAVGNDDAAAYAAQLHDALAEESEAATGVASARASGRGASYHAASVASGDLSVVRYEDAVDHASGAVVEVDGQAECAEPQN